MLTIHDRKKKRERVTVVDALCKALGWYFPLLAKCRVRSVEDLVFRKYPYACPYCRKSPHEDYDCKAVRGTSSTVNYDALRDVHLRNLSLRPKSLNEWQVMFQKIYPRGPEDRRSVIGLFEEIGELAAAIRVFEPHPEYFAGEAADVFSYLMGVANELGIRMLQDDNAEFSLQDEFLKRYPGLCTQCGSQICICPSVPEATVGRLAKELGLQTMSELFNPEPGSFAADGTHCCSSIGTSRRISGPGCSTSIRSRRRKSRPNGSLSEVGRRLPRKQPNSHRALLHCGVEGRYQWSRTRYSSFEDRLGRAAAVDQNGLARARS